MSTTQTEIRKVRVAAWQGRCADGDVEANLATVRRVIAEAGQRQVDFLCCPETFLSGYGARAVVERGALPLSDPRLEELARHAADYDLVLLVGLAERKDNGDLGNTVAIYWQGKLLGLYRKTMLTGADAQQMGFCRDYDLPIFHAKGLTFGCIICHDSSFIEPAAVLAYKGAQVIFSPHYNAIAFESMDAHRIRVRNNHVGLAALLGVHVIRANVVGKDEVQPGTLGYGDSAIFDPNGVPIAEAGLFTERLIMADIDPQDPSRQRWARREEVPERVRAQFAEQLLSER